MKKLSLFTLAALMFALAACTKSDPGTEPVRTTNPEGAAMHFYGVALPDVTRGAAQHDRLWHNGTTVKVKFLNGNTTMQDKVEEYAKEWEKYANITFKFVENEDAHVRVGFDWNANRWVTWSYIGTDCKVERNQAEATMSFADFDYKSEDEIRGDVLRAFGQALGLELESRNINFAPQWSSNVNRVKSYWELDIEDVTWDVIKQYVFDPLDADNAISTDEYDALSIMRWPFPGNILLNGGPSAGTANTELSELDKVFIAELYPKGEGKDYLARIEFEDCIYGYTFFLGVREGASVLLDWENGITDVISYESYVHEIKGSSVTIRGNAEALYELLITYGGLGLAPHSICVQSLDVSGCTHLKRLWIAGIGQSSLDLSNCPLLEYFNCYYSWINTIDLTNNPLIEELYINYSPLTSLDVSHNPFLGSLSCQNNQLTSLDVSNNPQLWFLDCFDNQLIDLDVSNNPLLEYLRCDQNQLLSLDVSNNPLLEYLCCAQNQLLSLDISNNSLLEELYCQYNQLASLNISNNSLLQHFACGANQLIDLDVSNNPLLKGLECSLNQLTSLDLSDNPLLKGLECSLNQLTSLDLSDNPLLEDLWCVNNQLTSLDVSNNLYLRDLRCYNNPFTSDQAAVVALANSLHDRNGLTFGGMLDIDSEWNWISTICAAKNWRQRY